MNKKLIIGKILLLSVATLFLNSVSAQDNDPVLMTIAGNKIKVSEFETIYKKNTPKDSLNNKNSVNNYLNLFVDYRLKVQEAEDLGMDTTTAFKTELDGYRKQLEKPYLTDKNTDTKLVEEAYDRLKKDIRASHILIRLNEDALPKDTLKAYMKIMEIRSKILKGMSFDEAAREYSEDPSAKTNGGDLGYFTALQMVYPFETMAYKTKVGEISMPVRTRFGYHIIKVNDIRPAEGEIHVAHIMIKTSSKMNPEDSLKAKQKIDEIYQKLQNGGNFSELAKQFSDDKGSAPRGGELPWFGTNQMPPTFEKAAFELQKDSTYSEPIKTRFGWHIIERLGKKELAPFSDMEADLKTKISKDSRSEAGKTVFIANVKKKYDFKQNLKLRDEFYKVVDSTFFEGKWDVAKAKKLDKPMFNLQKKEFTQADFARFLADHQVKRAKTDLKIAVNMMYDQFVNDNCVAYEQSRLDEEYPDFHALMQEYKDGILLFELTDKKVWTKAIQDSVGAKNFYEQNKTKYMWNERADASIYTCLDEKIAKEVKKMLKKKETDTAILAKINKDSQLNLKIESQVYQKKENPLIDANWKEGISENTNVDKNVEFVDVHKIIKPEPKSYEEAKGLITADYQTYLENEWITSLKQKYTVNIDQKVLSSIQ
ncbi:MAG: peptidylprolyl isomerase [Bacteroidia bacterium]